MEVNLKVMKTSNHFTLQTLKGQMNKQVIWYHSTVYGHQLQEHLDLFRKYNVVPVRFVKPHVSREEEAPKDIPSI